MRFARFIVLSTIAALSLAAATASGQETVAQGQGQSSGYKPWRVDIGAQNGGKTTEVAVTNSAGGSYVPGGATHAPLTGRKAIEIQNNGPNTIYCTVDASAPVVTTNGRWILAGAAWSLDAGAGVTIRCIAATAAQASGAATMVTELK
jgi:hypothetical protein